MAAPVSPHAQLCPLTRVSSPGPSLPSCFHFGAIFVPLSLCLQCCLVSVLCLELPRVPSLFPAGVCSVPVPSRSFILCVFSFVCSYSFVIPFDCLFPLRIFFFTPSGSFLFHLSSFFPSCFVFPLFLFSLLMVSSFVCVWIPHLPLSSPSSHFGWETSLRFFP